jgi:cytoskeletal protein CcmA (bactofilin family)
MFSKTADPTSAPARSSNAKSMLAQDLRITGEISSAGSIEILGEVDGTIHAHGLTVGPEGRVNGTVTAEVVEIKGKLDGKVASQSFTLRAAAEVTADVTYTTLVIESGASIEGKFALNKV